MQLAGNARVEVNEIPKFPAVHRDIAIIVPQELKYE